MHSLNPLKASQQPPMFAATPISLKVDASRLIQKSRQAQDRIISEVQPDTATFENVLVPLAHAENELAAESHTLVFYKNVSPDPAIRNASRGVKNLLDDFTVETAMREDLFKLVDAVYPQMDQLDEEDQYFLQKKHKEFIQNGLKLPSGPTRDRFKQINTRLSHLTTEFRENLAQSDDDGIWFTPSELSGVPQSVLDNLEKGQGGEHNGQLHLTFNLPDLAPMLRYATNSETRKRYYIANENKCLSNVSVFKEAAELRDEAARLLGYPNHAAFRIEDMMAKKPETVMLFLHDLRKRLAAGCREEVETLRALKKLDVECRGESFDGHFFHWDHKYYDRLMLEKQYSVNKEKIAEYFPLETTVNGILQIFSHLFGLNFVEISSCESSGQLFWHEDVQLFSVWNSEDYGGEFVGHLYLDLFPREGKYGNPSSSNVVPVIDAAG
jgi:metallopeptidase MepB